MGGFFDAPLKRKELEESESLISAPGFWDDQAAAQKIVQQRSRIEKALARQADFETGISDAEVLFDFAQEDADSAAELETLIERLDGESASECETSIVLALAPRSIRPVPSAGPGDPSQATAFKGERLMVAWADAMAITLKAKWPSLGE